MSNIKGNFTELNNIIQNAIAGNRKEIRLEKDYVFLSSEDFVDGIPIDNTTLTIDAADHTIDAGGNGRVFQINHSTVTLLNCKLRRGDRRKGGILESFDTCLVINKCVFEEGTGKDYGGALYVEGGSLSITNSSFISNESPASVLKLLGRSEGGAIYAFQSFVSIVNSTFEKNVAEMGGAVSTVSYLFVDDCDFHKNRSKDTIRINSQGGAVNCSGNLQCRQSSFTENYSEDMGGAICAEGEGNFVVVRNTFDRNSSSVGRAIRVRYGSNGVISENNFNHPLPYEVYYNEEGKIEYNWWGSPSPDWDQKILIVNGEVQKDSKAAPEPF